VRFGFAVRLAARESRHGIRRVGVYMASITLGVAALVAIHSFRDDVARSVREQAEILLGADVRLASNRPLPDSVTRIVDSLSAAGVAVARVTTTGSMVLAPASGDVRLIQLQAVEPGYPFYGSVRTSPSGEWPIALTEGGVLVDPAVLTQLRVDLGDTLVVGRERLIIRGAVDDLPTTLGYQTAVGPRIYVSPATLASAGLLTTGSLARYQAFLRIPDPEARQALVTRYEDVFEQTRVRFSTADGQAQELSSSVEFMGEFLALVGLGALLLGGIGVASAIHVYVKERRPSVAVLRCLGARQATLFTAYLLQAAGMGLAGSAAGVVLGVLVQRVLPWALAGVLPVAVTPRISLVAVSAGLGIGVWVSVMFALVPLLEVRNVPPLQALRRDFEDATRRRDPARVGAYLGVLGTVVLLCVIEAPEVGLGLGFAGGLSVVVALLAGFGWSLTHVVRRFFPSGAPYPIRQGVSNLFRPRNQTVSLTVALGFGTFVVGTIIQIQGSLLDDLRVSFGEDRPNVLLFDIQEDQVDGVRALLPETSRGGATATPLVSSRIVAIHGRSIADLRADTASVDRPEGWASRREYRNTSRVELGPAEALVEGGWWDDPMETGGLPRVSLEEDVAESLRVGVGDRITWNVAGVEIESMVSSIRQVDWERLEPNFFAVFEPGVLDGAPQTVIMVARLEDAEERAVFQRSLVGAFPNVSALDFSRAQLAIDAVLSRVRQAIAFLGAFSAMAGMVVLMGSLSASASQRMREAALLKTLGARRGQILRILLVEYVALGTLATATGLVLAVIASAVMVPTLFQVAFHLHAGTLAAIWVSVAVLTAGVGLLGSRRVLTQPPLEVLRDR